MRRQTTAVVLLFASNRSIDRLLNRPSRPLLGSFVSLSGYVSEMGVRCAALPPAFGTAGSWDGWDGWDEMAVDLTSNVQQQQQQQQKQ